MPSFGSQTLGNFSISITSDSVLWFLAVWCQHPRYDVYKKLICVKTGGLLSAHIHATPMNSIWCSLYYYKCSDKSVWKCIHTHTRHLFLLLFCCSITCRDMSVRYVARSALAEHLSTFWVSAPLGWMIDEGSVFFFTWLYRLFCFSVFLVFSYKIWRHWNWAEFLVK